MHYACHLPEVYLNFCVPGGTANTVNIGGQPIKLVSAQGQPVTLPNFQNVTLANTKSGVVQLRPANKAIVASTTTETAVTPQHKAATSAVKKIVPQNKNIVAKVILGKHTNLEFVVK